MAGTAPLVLDTDPRHLFKTSQDHVLGNSVLGNSVLSVRVAFFLGYVAAAMS